jgi:hypothetical protein
MKLRRLWFVMANAAFLLSWFTLCVLTIRRWHEMSLDSRFWAPGSAAMFLLLWLVMIREKNSTLAVVTGAMALLASMKTAFP